MLARRDQSLLQGSNQWLVGNVHSAHFRTERGRQERQGRLRDSGRGAGEARAPFTDVIGRTKGTEPRMPGPRQTGHLSTEKSSRSLRLWAECALEKPPKVLRPLGPNCAFAGVKEPKAAPLYLPENPRSAVWVDQAGCSEDLGQSHSRFLRGQHGSGTRIPRQCPEAFAQRLWAYTSLHSLLLRLEAWTLRPPRKTANGLDQIKGADLGFCGSREATGRSMKRKHAELPGEPAANNSVLLTTKVRDRDRGTEKWRKTG